MKKKGSNARRSKQEQAALHEFTVDSFSAIEEFLRYKPSAVLSLLVNRKHEQQMASQLQQLCGPHQIPVEWSRLDHVSIRAKVRVEAISFEEMLEEFESKPKRSVLVIDHITDPRNFGAMIRSAAFFGIRNILVARDRQAPITAATVATSMGGLALVEVVEVVNLVRSLRELKQRGFTIIGADGEGVNMLQTSSPATPCALVMGSEDRGLSRLIRECCDHIWSIAGIPPHVESLNVAVATGIMLQHLAVQQLRK